MLTTLSKLSYVRPTGFVHTRKKLILNYKNDTQTITLDELKGSDFNDVTAPKISFNPLVEADFWLTLFWRGFEGRIRIFQNLPQLGKFCLMR